MTTYEYIVTFVEQYELEHIRCGNVAMNNGFVFMKSLEDDTLRIDGKREKAFTFIVNSNFVKDIGVVEEGGLDVIGVEPKRNDITDYEF